MKRLTIKVGEHIYYAKGKYPPATLIAEMETHEVRECIQKLANYEDLEEELGITFELICKLSSKEPVIIYILNKITKIVKTMISRVQIHNNEIILWLYHNQKPSYSFVIGKDFQKTWFLTREEAEKKLEEMNKWQYI